MVVRINCDWWAGFGLNISGADADRICTALPSTDCTGSKFPLLLVDIVGLVTLLSKTIDLEDNDDCILDENREWCN